MTKQLISVFVCALLAFNSYADTIETNDEINNVSTPATLPPDLNIDDTNVPSISNTNMEQNTTDSVSNKPEEKSEYYIVDGSLELVKELADLSNSTTDPKIAYESARFANYISENSIRARMAGQKKLIIVNLPSYTLYAINVETGKTEIESKVIVGKKVSKTPIFSTNIKSITFNPTWTPPISVLKRSVYPSLGKKGGYADRHGLVINKDGYLLPLSTPTITREDLRGYTIYQPSGVHNSLGRIRFNTDNDMAIYLHDTNERSLFNKDARALSLGCVRVQDWQNLALWISDWNKVWFESNMDSKNTDGTFVTKTIVVPKLSVGIGYFTIKKDSTNNWVMADNVYDRDD